MASSFNGVGLFNSGPHRFKVGASGSQILVNSRINAFAPGSTAIGALEPEVRVIGRLEATSEIGLNALLATIAAQVNSPPTRGALVDHHGRTYADMDFVMFTPGDRVDRGRVISLAYEARFVRLTGS